jgi:superfamily II DNA or RNA helicase
LVDGRDIAISVNSQVRRVSTGELGVVVSVDGEYCDVVFTSSGRATLHIGDIELAPSDPIERLAAGQLAPHQEYGLRIQARYLEHAYKYDPLSGLSNARVEPKLHQVFVAHRVGKKPRPRMILADEVGLGKTIEAGLILKEQIARGVADRILIISPASLQYQWLYEMESKFNEEFIIIDGPTARMLERDGSNPWTKFDRIITSVHLARREDRALQIIDAPWDIVVFDEAHHVRRRYEGPDRYRATQAYRLADELKEFVDGLLLLTATPMQLHPFELYSLIELVEPGLYPSFEAYDRQRKALPRLNALMRDLQGWGALTDEEKAHAARQHGRVLSQLEVTAPEELDDVSRRDAVMDALTEHHPLSQTLVRNRKHIIGGFTERKPVRVPVTLNPDEFEVYQAVTAYISEGYNRARQEQNHAVGFLMVLYQKMLASSSNALRASFQKRVTKLKEELTTADAFARGDLSVEELEELVGEEELDDAIDALEQMSVNRAGAEWEIQVLDEMIGMLGKIRDSKAETLVYEVVEPWLTRDPAEKILIFTGFKQTQAFLAAVLESAGYEVVIFNGDMNLEEKELAVRKFRTSAQVMVTTEAGGEGRNFQFSHIMINYDLPWNPMVVEQRIGRLDRIGQKHDVQIYNLACEGTVEERVLRVLDDRIGLFEESVGSLDPILGEVEKDLERLIMEHAATLDRDIEHYGEDLEGRVKEARLREEILADFILDRASLRRDEAQKLLGEEPLAGWSDLRDFVGASLDYYGGRLSPHTEGGYSLSLSQKLSHRLRIKSAVTQGEFDPVAALRMEDLQFFAFGHETVDAIVGWASDSDALTGARRVESAPPGVSVEVFYELEGEGVQPIGRFVRHLIGESLEVNEETIGKVPELGEMVEVTPPLWTSEALLASRSHIVAAHQSVREQAAVQNSEYRDVEIERAERVFRYQQTHLKRRVKEGERWVEEVERAGTEGQKRVLPARRGRLNRDRERLVSLRETFDLQIESIRTRHVDVQMRVVSAGLVVGS